MKFGSPYPFLYLLIATVGGILSSAYFTCPWWMAPIWLLPAIAMQRKISMTTDICLLLAFFSLSNTLAQSNTHHFDAEKIWQIHARCEEELSGKNYILNWGGERIFLNRFDADSSYRIGDSLAFHARILPLRFHDNPQEFNYARYLEKQGISYRFQPISPISKTGHSENWRSFFRTQQATLSAKVERLTQDTTCSELMKAIGLGYKHDIPGEIKQLFITTGTVHLLAVSGLHVGMIYSFLFFFLKWFRLPQRKIKLCILPLLWGYACLTGLSPSVVRASLILTLITVGDAFERNNQLVNLLAVSACLTLWITPRVLYSLSFLLSYSAYAGLVLIYPLLLHLPGKLPRIRRKIYTAICVTIAAQLPTLPLCAYFFHSVNLSSLLSNLIAVPLASLFLYGTTACLILPETISRFLIPICEGLSWLLTKFLHAASSVMINLHDLYPTAIETVLWYIVLGCIIRYWIHQKKVYFHAVWISCVVLLGYSIGTNQYLSKREEIIVFHEYRNSTILVSEKGHCFSLKNTKGIPEKERPYVLYHHLQPLPQVAGILGEELQWIPPYLYYGKDTILLPDGKHVLPHSGNIAIITGGISPQQVFGKDFHGTYPSLILLDGSNPSSKLEKWRAFCTKHCLLFRYTGEAGAIHLYKKK